MNIAFTEEQLMIIILSLLFVIAIIVIVIEWRKNAVSKNNVLLLEKKTELKKIELVEKDLENKRRKEDMSDLSEEDQERLRQIRINTAEIIGKVGLLNTEVTEKVEQLEAKSELLKLQKLSEQLSKKEEEITSEQMRELERVVMLKVVDEKWMNHIDSMDELKNGIGLRAYGQKDPVVQYRLEGFDMFDEMINDIKFDVTKILMHIRQQGEVKRQETVKITGEALEAIHSVDGGSKIGTDVDRTVRNEGTKVGRNDPCPCGSGKKYKQCCGRNQ